MATYSKRGYKAPKERVDDSWGCKQRWKDSTTADVFSTLDETFKTEALLLKNQITSLVL
jgi:hypothetical protein